MFIHGKVKVLGQRKTRHAALILNGFNEGTPLEENIEKHLIEFGYSVTHLKLRDTNLQPCRSCGNCGFKTPGRCFINDDLDAVMQAVVKADLLVLYTPICFGAVSSTLKKLLDRFMLLGLPLYFKKNGRLYHPVRYAPVQFLSIGVTEEPSGQGAANFKLSVERLAENLSSPCEIVTLKPDDTLKRIQITPALTKLQEEFEKNSRRFWQ